MRIQGRRARQGNAALVLVLIGVAVLLPVPAGAVIDPFNERTTIELLGEDGQGRFTIFLEKTSTNSENYAFVLRARVHSNFEWSRCRQALSGDLCERDLWIAALTETGVVMFVKMVDGLRFEAFFGGVLRDLLDGEPFARAIEPAYRLGEWLAPGAVTPYPSEGHLFGLTQTVVNRLTPGRYAMFAFYTTRLPGDGLARSLADLATRLVSNLDEWDVIVGEGVRACSTQQTAGGDAADTRVFELGRSSGTFRFDFQTFSQRDRMIVSHQGRTLLDTGCVGTSASAMLPFSGSSSQVQVDVYPNCAGGSGTSWNYTVHCPVP